MANSDKNILITPSVGSATANPTIRFTGANNTPTTLRVLDDGTISFEGSAGQLFSISDGLSGTIFSVNDISGIPSIEVLDTGLVKLNQYNGQTVIGGASAAGTAELTVYPSAAANLGLVIRGAASQSGNLQEWQNSSGTVLSYIRNDGLPVSTVGILSSGNWIAAGSFITGATLVSSAVSATSIGVLIRGAASQTADLQQWQNSAGTILARIESNGTLSWGASGDTFISSGGYGRLVSTLSTAVGFIVRGAASQSVNLQEWQNSSSSVVASISSTGGATFASLTVSGDLTVNGTTTNINTTNLVVEDKNIILGDVTTPSDTTADGGGITLKGATDKTFNWINSTGLWTASVGLSAPTLTSTVATGTAPLTVTSTTAVANLNADLLDGNHASAFATLSGSTFTGQIISTRANDANTGAGQIYLNGATGNRIDFNTSGLAAPSFTTRSVGTKIVLYPNVGASTVDYAIGIEGSTLWQSITSNGSSNSFRWYAGTTNVMSLRGDATVSLNSTSLTLGNGSVTHQLGVVSGAAANVVFVVRGTTSQSANMQEWQDSNANLMLHVSASGQLRSGAAISGAGWALNNSAYGASSIGLLIRGAGSQTANLQEWQDSAGTILSRVSSSGSILTAGRLSVGQTSTAAGQFNVTNSSASLVTSIIQGSASQTADLTQWQNNTGTVLASVDADGNINGRITDPQIIQYGAEGSVLQNIPNRTHPAEQILKQAVFWIDANHFSASSQTIRNLGWAGPALNATAGSTSSADSNDPKYLSWDGTNYVYIPNTASNTLSIPDSAAIDITGDVDIRAKLAPDSWTGANFDVISKWQGGGQYSYSLVVLTAGTLRLYWSTTGSDFLTATSTVSVPFSAGQAVTIRATRSASTGIVKFFTSTDDGITWTQLGADVSSTPSNIFSGTGILYIGGGSAVGVGSFKIYRAQILSGIDGISVLDVDTSLITSGSTTSFSALTGQTVTINRASSGTKTVCVTTPCWALGTDDYIEVNNRWIPQGSNGQAIRLPGVTGNYLSVPDAAALDITGDIDLRAQVAMDDWTPGQFMAPIAKRSSNNMSYELGVYVTTGTLFVNISTDGTTIITKQSTVATGISDGSIKWIRATIDVDNGAGGYDVKFFLSDDGLTWTQLGSTVTTSGTITLYSGSSPVYIGAWESGDYFAGKVYRAQILNGINGTTVLDVDASRSTVGATTFTAVTGQTVTLNGSAVSVIPAAGVYLPGVAGNYLSSPDSSALDITGDIDVRVKVAMDDWTPAANSTFAGKWTAASSSWYFGIGTTGLPALVWSPDNVITRSATATVAPTVTDGSTLWIRAALDVDNGASQYAVMFYTSTDGSTWTQLGSTVTGTTGVTSIFNSTAGLTVGAHNAGSNQPSAGRFYRAVIYSDLTETTKVFDANMETSITSLTQTTFTESSTNAATVTINKSGTGYVSTPIVQSGYIYPTGTSNLTPSTSSLLDFGASDSFTVLAVARLWNTAATFARLVVKTAGTTSAGYALTNYATPLTYPNYIGDGTNNITGVTATAFTAGALNAFGLRIDRSANQASNFLNGTINSTTAISSVGSLANSRTLRIGMNLNDGNAVDTEVLAVAIFRRALTASEITTVSNYFTGRAA